MDPKLREILYRVKASAVDVGKTAGKFAGGVVERTKINLQIFDLNTEIDIAYKEIGKLVFAVHNGEEICSEAIQSKIEEIDAKNEQIAILRDKLSDFKNASKTCPACGKTATEKDAFCPSCGYKFQVDSTCNDDSCGCCDEAE